MFATQVSIFQSLTTISLAIGVLGVGAGVYSFLRFNNYKQTVSLQNQNIEALKELLATHEKQLTEQALQIVDLKARNETLETIPLQQILKSLDNISKLTMQILSNQAPKTTN